MPSGKHKSKENTWTEKDLTEALQSEKPRHSRDESSRPQEDGSQKRSKEAGHREKEKDRQRSKLERSEKLRDEAMLDPEEGSSRRTSESRDKQRKHKDRTRDKLRNGDDNERLRRESNKDVDRYERRKEKTRGDSQRLEKEEYSRSKESSRRSKEVSDDEKEHRRSGHDRDKETRRKDKNRDERWRDDENGDRRRAKDREEERRHKEWVEENDQERSDRKRSKDRGERRIDKERDEEKRDGERKRDKERNERRRHKEEDEGKDKERGLERRDKDRGERRRDKERDEERRGREKEDGRRDKEKKERRRDKGKEERRKDKDRDRNGSPTDETKSDRKKEKVGRHHKDGVEEDDDHEKERERRRRKKEEREMKERSKKKIETENWDKDESRKQKRDQERLKESNDDRRKRPEEKKHEHHEVNDRSSFRNEEEIHEEIANEDDHGEDNYEDDFEDYEDDFEDVEEDVDENHESEHDKGKLLEIFEAINAENDDVRRSPLPSTTKENSKEEEVKTVSKPVKSSAEGRINFFAAKQKHVSEFVASKTKKRAQELRHLIELDVASYDIFDLPPLNEYELYIKSYGQSDSKQAYAQCHDDTVEKEMQTEDIECSTRWTQYPPDDFKGYGVADEDVNKSALQESFFLPHIVDSIKLSNFLQRASQVCLILLEEKISGKAGLTFKDRNDIDISDGFIQLASKLPFLEGRPVVDMKFNSIQTHLLLTAHDFSCKVSNTNKDYLNGKGIVCLWNVNEPTEPQKILICESSPRSCCFSPLKSSLVFAGLDDGSIVIWDIRESSSHHSTVQYQNKQWIVRRPTFCTAGVIQNDNHLSPIQNVLPISLPKESAQASIRTSFVPDDTGGMAFQLASLEENGVVNIWVVVELEKPDEAGSERDLGLAPGGRVKLIKSTSIQIECPHKETFPGCQVQTTMMQFSTVDSNHFYVGTDRGWVVHCTRYGGRPRPRAYRPEVDSFVMVTSLDISPWSVPVLLVGCADGTLRLHDLRKELVICSWPESTQGYPVAQVKWSRSRPSLFFVLDTKSNLYIWDLLQKETRPVASECFKHGKLLFFSLSNDYESLGIGLSGRKSELVLNYEGGIIELHRLKPSLTNVQADELDRFSSLIDTF